MSEIERGITNEIDSMRREVLAVAHNAALTPEKLERALQTNIPLIEIDLTLVDGKLVIAHSLAEYYDLTTRQKSQQDPKKILQMIYDAGKQPFLDLKNEIERVDQLEGLFDLMEDDPEAMASSNNHELLRQVGEGGFSGTILYSLEYPTALSEFMANNEGRDFSEENSGVSIEHTLYEGSIPTRLKQMGLTVACWNPTEPDDIANLISLGAGIITSDNFDISQNRKS